MEKVYIIVMILMVSCFLIVSNFGRALRDRAALNVNDSNRKQVEELVGETNLLKDKFVKIEKQQMLGDWTLYLFYENGKEDSITFNDGEKRELQEYIQENGYADGRASQIKIGISLFAILGVIIYGIVCIVLKGIDTIGKKKENVSQ